MEGEEYKFQPEKGVTEIMRKTDRYGETSRNSGNLIQTSMEIMKISAILSRLKTNGKPEKAGIRRN